MPEELTKNLRTLKGEPLLAVFRVLRVDQACWLRLPNDVKISIQQILRENSMVKDMDDIKFCIALFERYDVFASINVIEFESYIAKMFGQLESSRQEQIISDVLRLAGDPCAFHPRPIFLEKAVQLFINAQETSVEAIGKNIILPLAPHFSVEHIQFMLEEPLKPNTDPNNPNKMKNPYILGSSAIFEIVTKLYHQTIQYPEKDNDWRNFVNAYEHMDVDEDIVENG